MKEIKIYAISFGLLALLNTSSRLYLIEKQKKIKCSKMYKSIEPIMNLVKVKHFTTSDIYFALNTKFTPILLLCFSCLLTTMDVLRTSIDCYTDWTGNGRKAIMDNFCWSVGTYICTNKSNSE